MTRSIGCMIILLAMAFTSRLRGEDILSITSETYSGECVGYCRTRLTITESKTTYAISAWHNEKPPKSLTVPTPKEQWQKITEALPLKQFRLLPETIGAPDALDQGGETLKVQTDQGVNKTDFEYGAALPGLTDFLTAIRTFRQEMSKKLDQP